ncbi:MAG: holo-[acyl-carrier protein] synthase [Phycisphaerales bacterium]
MGGTPPISGSIIGHGVDLTEVSRIEGLVSDQGQRFLDRCFTPGEQAYADKSVKRRFEHLAARFAAKEAAMKALGTGWANGVGWTDFAISNGPEGAPSLCVQGRAREIAASRGITAWHVSLSHTGSMAMASVIAEGPARGLDEGGA